MARPSIGDAVTATIDTAIKRDIKELTVLENGSEESIFHLIFEEETKDEVKQNGQ